jgi:hypothetical protein
MPVLLTTAEENAYSARRGTFEKSGDGLPIALVLSEGQVHDGKSAQDLLTRLEPGQILLAGVAIC